MVTLLLQKGRSKYIDKDSYSPVFPVAVGHGDLDLQSTEMAILVVTIIIAHYGSPIFPTYS